MNTELEQLEKVVAELTAPGQPFALDRVTIDRIEYRNFVNMQGNLGEYFQAMHGHADKEFVVYRDERYTFAEGYQHAAEFASALVRHYGVEKGDRVAIVCRNNPQWLMAFMAITAIGAVAVPMNAWWTTEELDYGFGDCGARVVIADRQRIERLLPIAASHRLAIISVDDCEGLDVEQTPFADLLASCAGDGMPAVDVALDDPATIMYTSGSTGHPKGALSSHRGILSALWSWMCLGVASRVAGLQEEREDALSPCALVTIPLFHCTASHSVFLLSLVVGRKLVIMHKWDVEEALRLIEAEKITWFNGVPTMSAELQAAAQNSDRDLSSLSEIMAGGAARPPDQVGKIHSTFRNSTPGIGYGLTETNALGAVNTGTTYLERPASSGRPVPPVTDFRIVDASGDELPAGERGELCIKSPANVQGYWNKPEATAEAFVDGWFHTGDIARLDEDGFVYIVDRIKEIIIRGGENISCIEVEAAIYAHPAVLEAAVFGLPDERLGEIVGAAVVLREGCELEEAELQEHLRPHLAAFKVPTRIFFREEQLPRIASGKILKRQVKRECAEALGLA